MSGYTFVPLHRSADASRLQELLERCSDYYLLHENWPTPADAADYELSAVAEGRSADDLLLIGMAVASGELIAFAQVLRDYPEAGGWWIGLLVVTPALRGSGVGSQMVRELVDRARDAGARSLHLIASPRNPAGIRFWERCGFAATGRVARVVARSGHADEAHVFVRPLQDDRA